MKILISPLVINCSKPHFPPSFFLFDFPSFSRENRRLKVISQREWMNCPRPRVQKLSCVRAKCVSESVGYGGWDNLGPVGNFDNSGETDQFRDFLVSIGVDDKKYVFIFLAGIVCALAISRVRISSIVVFPASILVFVIGFSFGIVRGGGIGEVNFSGNKRRIKDENLKVYVEKSRNLLEFFDGFDVKVSNVKHNMQKAISSREIRVADLENYVEVLESICLSASNARSVVEASVENLGSSAVVLAENQKPNKRKTELGEIGYEFLQSIGSLFRKNLVDSKPVKGKSNAKRESIDSVVDDQTRRNKLAPSVEEKVLNSDNLIRPKESSFLPQDPSNKFTLDDNGNGRTTENGRMSLEEIGGIGKSFMDSKEYNYQNNRLRFVNNHQISLKMDNNNQNETWESHHDQLDYVNFSVRMKHTETEASIVREQKLKNSDRFYNSSKIAEKGENGFYESPFSEEGKNGKDNSSVAENVSENKREIPSSSSSTVSDDVLFDRYLTEANDLLKQAKEFIGDEQENERAEIILLRSAKLLSKAIAMKPMSLLAVGQLGNTYLLHGELKLRISRKLRVLLYRSNPSSIGILDRYQFSNKNEIASVLINSCEECEELLLEAGRKYRLALSIDGNDVRALYNWGLALTFRAQLIADIGPEAAFDADKVFMAAIDKFDAMMSKGNVYVPDALLRWGMALQQRSRLRPSNSKEKVKLLQQAKRLFEDALDMDTNNVQVREALSTCLSELSSRQY
ncbi:hypothetical protein UlMin_017143 [Ulmus minor]